MPDDVEARRQRSKSLMYPSDWTRKMKREAARTAEAERVEAVREAGR